MVYDVQVSVSSVPHLRCMSLIFVSSHRLRYNKNLTESAPHAFTSDDIRELVQHCEQNHPAGWGTLRGIPTS